MNHIKLNDGNLMPANGFGTFQIPGNYLCSRLVTKAVDLGYRLIDTAEVYNNEEMVGRGINNSVVSRDDLFVTSKLWVNNSGYTRAQKAIDKMLTRLRLDYVDLLLIHQPFGDYYGTWRAMEEAQKAGKIKSLGVSNFPVRNVIDLQTFNSVKPVVDQIEINPWRQENDEVMALQQMGVQPEAWSPLAEGRNQIFTNDILRKIAIKHEKTIAQIILRWALQRNIITVAKSVHVDRIQANLQIYDFELDSVDMKMIKSLDQNHGSVESLCGNLESNDLKDISKYSSYARQLRMFL